MEPTEPTLMAMQMRQFEQTPHSNYLPRDLKKGRGIEIGH